MKTRNNYHDIIQFLFFHFFFNTIVILIYQYQWIGKVFFGFIFLSIVLAHNFFLFACVHPKVSWRRCQFVCFAFPLQKIGLAIIHCFGSSNTKAFAEYNRHTQISLSYIYMRKVYRMSKFKRSLKCSWVSSSYNSTRILV